MRLALATDARAAGLPGWSAGGADAVPAEHAIRGVFGVTLWVEDAEGRGRLLAGPMGWRRAGAGRHHDAPGGGRGVAGARGGRARRARLLGAADGVGSVHHVAFRVADAAAQRALTGAVTATGLRATNVRDRQYFESVYFRAPGGVLFELATDGPGFAVDEDPAALGEALRLPPQFEPHRATIAAALPSLEPDREPEPAEA
jgi:glyoxalase family protein